MLPLHLALVSESNAVGISAVTRTAAALQKQVLRDFLPIWGIPATVDPFDRLEDVPLGYWPMIVEDDIHQAGAEGIHLDEDGQPFSLIEVGESWSLTASHECLEMLVDPFGDRIQAGRSIKPGQGRVEYLIEVCDPCEALDFAYTVNGIVVSDFYTPSYFEPIRRPGTSYSFTGAVTRPREVLKGGYLSWRHPPSNHWWQAVFGNQLRFVDLGVLTGKITENLRATIDKLTPFEDLAPELVGVIAADDPRLAAVRVPEDEAAEATESKAESWRRQIANLRAGP